MHWHNFLLVLISAAFITFFIVTPNTIQAQTAQLV
jgi:hypothetical protein